MIDQTPSQVSTEFNQRFGGIARLYGVEGLKNLMRARVLVVGLGGVGSWAAESLARSGVGYITLVDLDDICITNTNRQLPAMSGSYGKLKIHAMRERIHAINPDCHVNAIEDFFTESTADGILETPFDYAIDAIDSLKNKALLISKCQQRNIPILITGGAAGKIDPTQIRIDDLGMSSNDALLFRLRKLLRRDFDFAPGFKSGSKRKKFNIMCVYSPEDAIYPTADGGTCNIPDPESNLKLDCESGMGSVSHITALFGMMAAGNVVNTLSGVKVKKTLQ